MFLTLCVKYKTFMFLLKNYFSTILSLHVFISFSEQFLFHNIQNKQKPIIKHAVAIHSCKAFEKDNENIKLFILQVTYLLCHIVRERRSFYMSSLRFFRNMWWPWWMFFIFISCLLNFKCIELQEYYWFLKINKVCYIDFL